MTIGRDVRYRASRIGVGVAAVCLVAALFAFVGHLRDEARRAESFERVSVSVESVWSRGRTGEPTVLIVRWTIGGEERRGPLEVDLPRGTQTPPGKRLDAFVVDGDSDPTWVSGDRPSVWAAAGTVFAFLTPGAAILLLSLIAMRRNLPRPGERVDRSVTPGP